MGNASLTLTCWKPFPNMKDKKLFGSSQHGFVKEKSCLTNLLAFYNEITALIVEEGRAVEVVYVEFSKAFDTVSGIIFIGKLKMVQSR